MSINTIGIKKSTLLVYSNISPVDSIRGIHMFEYRRKKDKKPINNYVLSKISF